MKRIYRIILKYLFFLISKFLKIFIWKFNVKMIPSLGDFSKFKYEYSYKTKRLVLRTDKNRFGKVVFDGSNLETYLCKLGKKYYTNKSSLNLEGHRSGYTGLYTILFSQLQNKKCSIAEIGIWKNASTNMWRKYFSEATIDCFEFDKKKLELAKKQKLKKVYYHFIDVNDKKIINDQFKKLNRKFDVIIDDSTHIFEHQINIIESTINYIKKGGMLIIEDIYRFKKGHEEIKYHEKIKKVKNKFSNIFFIETPHVNNFTASYKSEKILLLIKK